MKEKLTSRKLWIALIGIVTGISIIVAGETSEGVATLITSILGYLIAEGWIDAKAVSAVGELVDNVESQLENLEGAEEDEY